MGEPSPDTSPSERPSDDLSLPITHPTRRKMSGTARSGLFLTARRGLLTSDGVICRDSHVQTALSNARATPCLTSQLSRNARPIKL
jgi:hypothetical protein